MHRFFSFSCVRATAVLTLIAAHLAHGATEPPPAATTPPPVLPVTVKVSVDQVAAFRNYLEKSRQAADLPGMALIIVQPGQILALDCFGKKSATADDPVTLDTRFALGPATEAINSLLLEILAGQKRLDLDAPAHRCWDEFKFDDDAATKAVTLRQLLDMTSGLPARVDRFLAAPASTPADLFTILAQIPDNAQPGRIFDYSDASSAAAGYLAIYALNDDRAPATGLPAGYAALAKAQIFEPLGMKHATYDTPTDDDEAVGHTHPAVGPWQPVAPVAKSGGALLPALGLRVSARDVAAWLQFELSGGVAPNGKRLLDADALQERWRPPAGHDDLDFGLGWASQHYRGIELIARIGEQNSQASLIVIIPQYRTAMAVLTNAGGHDVAIFLQNALLNLADFLHENAPGS